MSPVIRASEAEGSLFEEIQEIPRLRSPMSTLGHGVYVEYPRPRDDKIIKLFQHTLLFRYLFGQCHQELQITALELVIQFLVL